MIHHTSSRLALAFSAQKNCKCKNKHTVSNVYDALSPDARGWRLISGHDEHLKALDAIPELVVLAGEALVLLLQMCNVLGRLAEDGGLVELVRGGESAEILLGILFEAISTLGL